MFTKENAAHYGRMGGMATSAKHGYEHYRRIGLKGYHAVIDRHFGGCEASYKAYLVRLAKWNYWVQTRLPMRYDVDGRMIWQKPRHPANKIPF